MFQLVMERYQEEKTVNDFRRRHEHYIYTKQNCACHMEQWSMERWLDGKWMKAGMKQNGKLAKKCLCDQKVWTMETKKQKPRK